MPLPANPTVNQLLAYERRPGLAPLAPAGNANPAGLLSVLGRILKGPANALPPPARAPAPTVPAIAPPAVQPAPLNAPAAPALPRASPERVAIHKANVARLFERLQELIGGNFSPDEQSRVNRLAARELLHDASDEEIDEAAWRLATEFDAGPATPLVSAESR